MAESADGGVACAATPVVMQVGKITQYVQGADWESYTEQVEFYFTANNITDPSRKKAILLANMPTDTYRLIKDLLAPDLPKNADVSYRTIGL